MSGENRAILAVDVGGTKYQLALFAGGRIVKRHAASTDRAGGAKWMFDQVLDVARGWRSETALAACGVGFGGPVDFERQRVQKSMHVPGWEGVDLAGTLARGLAVPVVIDNDANAAALGEFVHGGGRDCPAVGDCPVMPSASRQRGRQCRSLFYATLSTGIGGGIVIDGKVWRGANSAAGEFGHMTIVPDGPECLCGARGCLERLCGGIWLEKSGKTAKELLADEGLARDYARTLAVGLRNVIMLLAPERIVLGGGISKAGDRLFVPLREAVRDSLGRWPHVTFDIIPSPLGDDNVLWGAYELARPASGLSS